MHRAIVFNINFRAGLRDNSLDSLAAGANERPDLLRLILIVSMRGAYLDNSARGFPVRRP